MEIIIGGDHVFDNRNNLILLIFTLLIPRLNANIVSIESAPMLDQSV